MDVDGGEGGGSHLHSGSASFFRIHKSMLSRVWKCVKQGAAACPCARLMKKITEVIQMQLNERSPVLPPLTLFLVFPVEAEEGGQAVLDCFLPWHRLLFGKPEYYYSWAPGKPGTKKVLQITFVEIYFLFIFSNYSISRVKFPTTF